MTLAKFEVIVRGDGVGKNDQEWFPKWMRRYAMNFRNGLIENLPINRSSVVNFSKSLLKNGAPAWQRLQAVRALECYRDLVLQRSEPSLVDVVLKLSQLWGRKHLNNSTSMISVIF